MLALLLVGCAAPASPPAARSAAPAPPAPSAALAEASAGAGAAATVAPHEGRKVRVGMSTYAASYMDELVAIEKGYFREEGLDIEFLIGGGGVLTPALVAGEIQFSTSASSALSAMIQGADLRVVYTNLDRPAYQLWSSTPEIRTLHELVGRRIAISTRGDTHETSLRLLLRKYGIDPNVVVYAAVGSPAARVSALESGVVDAATLSPRDLAQIGQPRGNLLADIAREVKLVYTGVATSGPLARTEPDLVERYLRAIVKGREFARRYREQTIDIVNKFAPTSREVNEQDYDENVLIMTDEGWLSDDVLREEVATRAEIIGAIDPPAPQDLFDYSIVKKVYADLKARGLQPMP